VVVPLAKEAKPVEYIVSLASATVTNSETAMFNSSAYKRYALGTTVWTCMTVLENGTLTVSAIPRDGSVDTGVIVYQQHNEVEHLDPNVLSLPGLEPLWFGDSSTSRTDSVTFMAVVGVQYAVQVGRLASQFKLSRAARRVVPTDVSIIAKGSRRQAASAAIPASQSKVKPPPAVACRDDNGGCGRCTPLFEQLVLFAHMPVDHAAAVAL
jgi:hypothetical protein